MSLDKKFEDLLLNVSSRAALASYSFIGKKDKIAADKAAVDSMRNELNKIEINEIFNAGLQYLEQSLTLEKLMFFF